MRFGTNIMILTLFQFLIKMSLIEVHISHCSLAQLNALVSFDTIHY